MKRMTNKKIRIASAAVINQTRENLRYAQTIIAQKDEYIKLLSEDMAVLEFVAGKSLAMNMAYESALRDAWKRIRGWIKEDL